MFSHCPCAHVGQSVPSVYDRDKTGPTALGSPHHHPWALQPSGRRCQQWPPCTERGSADTGTVLTGPEGARHGSSSTLDGEAEPPRGFKFAEPGLCTWPEVLGSELRKPCCVLTPVISNPSHSPLRNRVHFTGEGTKETREELAKVTGQQVAETGLVPDRVCCMPLCARHPHPPGPHALGPDTQASAIWPLLASGCRGELPPPTTQRCLSLAEIIKAGGG